MVLLVIMGIALVLETVMVLASIAGLLKPLNPNGVCPKTHYMIPFFNGFNG